MKLNKIIGKIEEFYPKELASEWDNVGLQVGSKNKDVNKILTALEITKEVIEEALDLGVDLIVAHHPLIFKKIKNICEDNHQNKLLLKLIKSDIAVYVTHTNIDIAPNGLNDWLCEVLEIGKTSVFEKTGQKKLYNLNLEVDLESIEVVLDILPKLGIGVNNRGNQNYLVSPKIKRFKNRHKIIEKDCAILEVTTTLEQIETLKKYLIRLKKENNILVNVSSYEIYGKKLNYGLGRVGFTKPKTLEQLAEDVKNKIDLDKVCIVGNSEAIIKKIAIVGGSGASEELIDLAKQRGCDVYITGDVKYHQALYAKSIGLCLIDAGHYMEIIFNDGMCEFLKLISGITVYSSQVNTNPFEVV